MIIKPDTIVRERLEEKVKYFYQTKGGYFYEQVFNKNGDSLLLIRISEQDYVSALTRKHERVFYYEL